VAGPGSGSKIPQPSRAEISRLVERFLARAKAPASAAPAPDTAPAAPAGAWKAIAPLGAAKAPPEAPAPPRPVDFVSEDDVRVAIKKGSKIHVGPRTIITPSARDLGDPREIFVMTKGPAGGKDTPSRSE